MFGNQIPPMGEFHHAYLIKNINDETTTRFFKFKAPDDEQFRKNLVQYQRGDETVNIQFAIYTTAGLDFEIDDTVHLVNEDIKLKITTTREHYNSPLAMVNMLFPNLKGNKGIWLILGEG